MADEIRRANMPYAILSKYAAPHYFKTLEEAQTYSAVRPIVAVWETRNRTDGDGFTEWRESYTDLEDE